MTAEYDLLILDIMLPDVNGWDIVRMLRSAGKAECPYCSSRRSAPLNTGSKGLSWVRMII
jgi:DNA-binding response OmpR family regulator